MRIAYCCVVRNDTDILPFNVQHYYNIGIRDFYFLLHLPDKKLYACIEQIKTQLKDANVSYTCRFDDSHYHEKDVKTLTDKALKDGCDWLCPSDADEIIVLKKHSTLQDFLKEYDGFDEVSLLFKWTDYLPTRECEPDENPYLAYTHHVSEYRKETKCIAKFPISPIHFVAGIHFAYGSQKQIHIDPLIAHHVHFPDRSLAQFEEKYLIQNKNWLSRYGSFPISEQIAADPDFLKKFWVEKLVTDTSSMIYEPISDKTFGWPL